MSLCGCDSECVVMAVLPWCPMNIIMTSVQNCVPTLRENSRLPRGKSVNSLVVKVVDTAIRDGELVS